MGQRRAKEVSSLEMQDEGWPQSGAVYRICSCSSGLTG